MSNNAHAMIATLLVAGLVILSGCAARSSGVLKIGPDSYLVSATSDIDRARGGTAEATKSTMAEATNHCAALGNELLVTRFTTTPPNERGYGAGVEVTFRCLEKGHPDLSSSGYGKP